MHSKAFTDAAIDAVARAIADVKREAERAEALRAAEHRAFMAEQREGLAEMRRAIELKLSEVKDGRDGIDGKDGSDGAPGVDGVPGKDGENGRDGIDGKDGADGAPGIDGAHGRDGIDGKDGSNGVDGMDGVSVFDAKIEDGILLLELSNGEVAKAGPVVGPSGERGEQGPEGPPAYVGEAKGLFDPAAEYLARDVVALNGSAFMAKIDNPGECPGEGWMLLAQRGKRGDKGDRGERGTAGMNGKDGAQPVGLAISADTMEFRMILDNGEECSADFYPIAQAIRGDN
jgi:hypothetical protein